MPRELQNQPAGASLSVMFSRTQLAGSRLRIVARQINHLCRGSLTLKQAVHSKSPNIQSVAAQIICIKL